MIVVLLNCKNMDCRWLETHKLAKWAAKRMSKIKQFCLEQQVRNGLGGGVCQMDPKQLLAANIRLLNRIKHL